MSILSVFKKNPKRDKYAEAKANRQGGIVFVPVGSEFSLKHDEHIALAYDPTASLNDVRQTIGLKKTEKELEMKHNCYIAIYESFGDEYNNTEIITEKQYIEENLNLYSVNGGGYCRCRFNFCPICGAVIDWDKLKQWQSEG